MPGSARLRRPRRVEPQAEAVEVVVADRPGGAPGREFAQRPQSPTTRAPIGWPSAAVRVALAPIVRPRSLSSRIVKANQRSPSRLSVITGLPGAMISPEFGDADADRPIGRCKQLGLVELRLQARRRGPGQPRAWRRQAGAPPAVGPAWSGRGCSPLAVEIGLGLGERGLALVELLLAQEALGIQGHGPIVLLLRQQQVGFGGAHGLGSDRHLLGRACPNRYLRDRPRRCPQPPLPRPGPP